MDYYITCAFLLIVCSLTYIYFKNKLRYFEKLGIPCIAGWPVLGTFWDCLMQRKHMTEAFQELYNLDPAAKYVGAFNFTKPVFVIKDLELIKSITIRDFDNFPDHPPVADLSLDPLFGGNLFNLLGQEWKDSRAMLTPSFTSTKMKAMYGLMEECAKSVVDFMAEQPSEKLKMFDTKELFLNYSTDVVASCAFGIKTDALRDPTNRFVVLAKEASTQGGFLSLKMMLSQRFPSLMKALGIRLFPKRIAEFFTNIVSSTVEMRREKGITRPDMLQLMMDSRYDETESNVNFDIERMTSHVFLFFIAGFVTTASAFCSIAHELALNAAVQRRLQAEIDEVMAATKGQLNYDAVQGMQLLDAIYHEIMRLHPPATYLDRVCKQAFELPAALPGGKPVTVKPDTLLWIPVSSIHRDPRYYDNPDKFDPDRYCGKKITVSDTTTLGFGIGPRYCIGNRFAILETKILLFHMLAKYSFEPNERTCRPLRYAKNNFFIQTDGGSWLDIKPRDNVVSAK